MAAVRQVKAAWTGLGRRVSLALLIAGVWALGLIVAGFLAPAYRTATESTSGEVAHGTQTAVGANGLGVVVGLAVPFMVTVLVGCALLLRGHRGALPVAWTLTGLLAMFTLLSMPSIGLFIIPTTASLLDACSTLQPKPGPVGPVSASSAAQ